MNNLSQPFLRVTAIALLACVPSARADLPMLSDAARMGYFAIHSDRSVELGITTSGVLRYMPALGGNPDSGLTDNNHALEISPVMIATAADGQVTRGRLAAGSLSSQDEPTAKLKEATITGELTDGGKFEFKVHQNNGAVVVTGQQLNPEETKLPQQFTLEVKVLQLITNEKLESMDELAGKVGEDRKLQRELGDFLKHFRSDRLIVRRIDGSEGRYPLAEMPEGGATIINGPGLKQVEIESSMFEARRVIITAETGSSMILNPSRQSTLLTGFTLNWARNAASAPDGKARLAIAAR
jgi:hypothetical protein